MKQNQLTHKLTFFFFGLLSLSLLLSSCNDDDDDEPPRPAENVVQILTATDGLDSLAKLLSGQQFAGLREDLQTGEYTIFAPNNTAFQNLLLSLGLGSMADLRTDVLGNIVNYHVAVNTAQRSGQLDTAIISRIGQSISIQRGDSIILNPESQPSTTVVVSPDVLAQNGVIHVINNLLLPPGYAREVVAPNIGTLAGLSATFGGISIATINEFFLQTGIFNNLGNPENDFTILAPPDQFIQSTFFGPEETLQGVTSLHVLPGDIDISQLGRTVTTIGNQTLYVTQNEGTTFFNGIPAFSFDLVANNGELLLIPGVLHEPRSLDVTIDAAEATSDNTYDVFRQALEIADLDLGQNRTIFMPTDSAFARAGIGMVIDSVSRIDPAVLSNLLLNHVVEGIRFFPDLSEGSLPTLSGSSLTLTSTEQGGLNIVDNSPDSEDAQILISSDYLVTGNIVVHSIDQVLIP
ncbi:MAG: fasciclin domain-containing protein [Cyclobacteriaceae bacterium]